MAYQRQARAFTFSNFDATQRTVDVVLEKEDHSALIRRPHGEFRSVGGTVAMSPSEFARSGAVRMVHR